MNTLKKLLIALLALSMLCAPLASCKKNGTEENPSTEPEQTEEREEDFEPIVLCDTKTCYYRIVRPNNTLAPVTDAATKIMDYPNSQGVRNMTFKWTNDKTAATDAEILVGFTNRPESLEVLKSINHDDFAIRIQNGKIVIAAHTPERLSQAVDYFCEKLLQVRTNDQGKKEIVYLGDYTYTGSVQYLFNKQDELKNYVIVYPKGAENLKESAELFQKNTKEIYGVELPVVDDTAAESACEILIGKVNRSIAKEYLEREEAKQPLVCTTVVKDQKILFASQNEDLVDFLVANFCKKYMIPEYSFLIHAPASLEEIGDAFKFSDSTALADGADLRVMSFNILCELFNELAVIEGRQIPVIAPIFTYKPDILGMQEVSDAWYPELEALFGDLYAFADSKDKNGDANFTPLVYNTQTLTLLEHGVEPLPVVGNGHRTMSWGYFERKSDGVRFVAINTHLNPGDKDSDMSERVVQAGEMAKLVLSMQKKYQCPVITTGDYNSRLSEAPIKTYMENSGMLDACQSAKVVNRSIKTTHELFTQSHRGPGEAIDHVFASSDVELLFYNVLIDECLAPSSDHNPIYVDVKLKK